jgi:hypothetical protein
MRIILAGRDNTFNRKLFSEFAKDNVLLCCLFLEPDRFKFSEIWRKIRKRIVKYGLLKVIDQLSFHLVDRLFIRGYERKLNYINPEYFIQRTELNCPTFYVSNVHDTEWLTLIKSFFPDIIISTCCNIIYRPSFYNIPKFGTFILHEGITPEYRGLHTTLWALLKKDFNYIGYSVIKANDVIDGGEILVQENYKLKSFESVRTWGLTSHLVLIEGLDHIKNAFKNLEQNKTFVPVDIINRNSEVYTWMTLSKYIRLLFRL